MPQVVFSPDLIKDMLEDNHLWAEPLQFVVERATKLKVSDFIQAPSKGEYDDHTGNCSHRWIPGGNSRAGHPGA